MEYDFVAHTEPLHNNALQYLIKRSIFIIHESVLHEILTQQCFLTGAAIINRTMFLRVVTQNTMLTEIVEMLHYSLLSDLQGAHFSNMSYVSSL